MSKFIHALVIERVTYDDTTRDSEGQPTASAPVTSAVNGLVQPKSAKEMEDWRSAGSQVADHTIFLPRDTDLEGADAIVQGVRRYSVTGVRRFEYGGLTHLEVDATLVTSTLPAVGS